MLVGKESFCDFKTIQAAIDTIGPEITGPITIYILEGRYEEKVVVSMSDISLIGLGDVVITYGDHALQLDDEGNELGTFRTATLYLDGTSIHMENITVENTAGHGEYAGQALAVYANCDESTFSNCRFSGHQDTLLTGPLPPKQKNGSDFSPVRPRHDKYRQYYYRCTIEGTVDFIFGGATAYFDQCLIKSKKRPNAADSYITAASTPEHQPYGYVFDQCILTAEKDCDRIFLGRPWRSYAKVIYQNCMMGEHIHPERWNDWRNEKNRKTADFREYGSHQPGLKLDQWEGWTDFEPEAVDTIIREDVFDTSFFRITEEKGSKK
jgi:pectinesterase